MNGQPREIALIAPADPLGVRGFGGDTPSALIDPGQWLQHADRLASSVPGDADRLAPPERARAAKRLDEAADSVDEALKFIPPRADRVPPSAFFTPIGRVEHAREPGRFRADRLRAVSAAYRLFATRLRG